MKHKILPGKSSDIEGLILRESDIDELKACCSGIPEEQLRESWETSEMRYTIWYGDKVAGVFGCAGIAGKFGVPWMLGSDLTSKVKRVFIVDAKVYVELMLKKYNRLMNFVYSKNKQSIRWLEWIGYTLEKPVPFGEFGELFHPFHKESNV